MASLSPVPSLAAAFAGRSVLVTGHTGFKGAWLCQWLHRLGARVSGFALPPPTEPSLFERAGVAGLIDHRIGDIRDPAAVRATLAEVRPDIVFHLAAQPLVLDSYAAPAETFAINLGGTITLMEALRDAARPAAVVMVTTDKVYRNREWSHAYREEDSLGGRDPYSASKAAMEVAVACWRDSFFGGPSGIRMASARAGNVIGGGDWAPARIVPDLIRAVQQGERPRLRHPQAQRPWQHVLEPLAGYLRLAASLATDGGDRFAQAWNFGPQPTEVRSVGALADAMTAALGRPGWEPYAPNQALHEAGLLRLAIDKSVCELGWRPVWDFAHTVERTAAWYRRVGPEGADAAAVCEDDIGGYERDAASFGMTA